MIDREKKYVDRNNNIKTLLYEGDSTLRNVVELLISCPIPKVTPYAGVAVIAKV